VWSDAAAVWRRWRSRAVCRALLTFVSHREPRNEGKKDRRTVTVEEEGGGRREEGVNVRAACAAVVAGSSMVSK